MFLDLHLAETMEDSELVNAFKTLSAKELEHFSIFLSTSPHAAKGRYRQEVQNLFNLLYEYIISGDSTSLETVKVFKQVFSADKPVVPEHLVRVRFELNQILRTFLVIEHYLREENSTSVQLDYAQVLKSRELISKSTQILNQTLSKLKEEPIKTVEQYGLLFQAAHLVYNGAAKQSRWKDDLKIIETLGYLDQYYSLHKLNLLNHYLLISRISRLNPGHTKDINPNAVLFPDIQIKDDPNIFIAYKIYLLLSEVQPNKAGFDDLMQLLTIYEPQLNASSVQSYFSYLRNYCSMLIKHGHYDLWPVLHHIHIDNLKKGYFLHNGKIPSGACHNIANTALRAKNITWALTFIEQYKDKVLQSEQADEIFRLNMANYSFHTAQFEEALDYLPPASNDLEMHLNGRRLELKIYYELQSDLLTYKLDAFKMYISRASKKLLSDETRDFHANFVNLLLQLSQIPPGDIAKATRVLERIQHKSRVGEKEWLLEKAKKAGKK